MPIVPCQCFQVWESLFCLLSLFGGRQSCPPSFGFGLVPFWFVLQLRAGKVPLPFCCPPCLYLFISGVCPRECQFNVDFEGLCDHFCSLKSTILAKFSLSNCLHWGSIGVGGCVCLVG